MKKKMNDIIYAVSRYTEIAIAILLLLVMILLIIPFVYDFFQTPLLQINTAQFMEFLGNVLTLLIGIEFVKLLAKHTAETLLEVLMFATARQMIVEHLSMTETLIGIVSIGAIFAVRKYLLLKTPEDKLKMNDKL